MAYRSRWFRQLLEVVNWVVVCNVSKLQCLSLRRLSCHKQVTYILLIRLAPNGTLVLEMRKIISSMMTCHIMSWTLMKNVENLHICNCLTDLMLVVLDPA
uniref:Uncharacterized protein n=1 Tax=Opuntia streptacantha TaxID=393608 RepID=A0A7C8ZYC2_OPUST